MVDQYISLVPSSMECRNQMWTLFDYQFSGEKKLDEKMIIFPNKRINSDCDILVSRGIDKPLARVFYTNMVVFDAYQLSLPGSSDNSAGMVYQQKETIWLLVGLFGNEHS